MFLFPSFGSIISVLTRRILAFDDEIVVALALSLPAAAADYYLTNAAKSIKPYFAARALRVL